MKLAKKIITPRARKIRLKKFSKHWLDAVRLSDVSVLADSGDSGDDSDDGAISYGVDGSSGGDSDGDVMIPAFIPAIAASVTGAINPSKTTSKTAPKISASSSSSTLTTMATVAGVIAAATSKLKAATTGHSGRSPITGVGAFVSPWNTKNPATNPPLFNFSTSFISLTAGGHFGKISIENVGNGKHAHVSSGNWRIVAKLDGAEIISMPYDYHGANQSYLEINVGLDGTWTFWGEFGSVSRKVASNGLVGPSRAEFGCTAGAGDYLMYNAFTNCAVNYGGSQGWTPPNFTTLAAAGNSKYKAAHATEDSVLFQDDPPY